MYLMGSKLTLFDLRGSKVTPSPRELLLKVSMRPLAAFGDEMIKRKKL
jgi:hypothetical protein